jgi:hypothetical protein
VTSCGVVELKTSNRSATIGPITVGIVIRCEAEPSAPAIPRRAAAAGRYRRGRL